MKKIELTNGGHALVDDGDYEKVCCFTWRSGTRGYAETKFPRRTTVLMHRLIMGVLTAGRPVQVDHRDGNRLDNRRQNLRICNNSQNHANMRQPKKSSRPYKGVWKTGPNAKWRARIVVRKEEMELGCFDTAEDAARAYNAAAVKYFGEYAFLNEIPGDENVRVGIGDDVRPAGCAA